MHHHLGILDYVIIGITMAISAFIGLYLRFEKKAGSKLEHFLLAGKKSNVWTVSFSLMATAMSSITILGLPAEVYKYGPQLFGWLLGIPAGIVFAYYIFLPSFFELDISTANQYLNKRFGSSPRTFASTTYLIYLIFYVGIIVYTPALALNVATGLSLWASITCITLICTIYCTLGGLKAVLWTDLFQSILIFISLSAVILKGWSDFGVKGTFAKAASGNRLIFFNLSLDFTERFTLWNSFALGFTQTVFYYGTSQAQVQRILSLGTLKKAKTALFISIPLFFLVMILCLLSGFTLYAHFQECDPIQNGEIKSADQLLPYFIVENFHHYPGIAGLCISGIFAGSLTTISSLMNSLSSIIVEDFLKPHCRCINLTEARSTAIAKIAGIIFGGVCLIMSYIMSNTQGILESGSCITSTLAGPMIGIFTLGLFTKRANSGGILIGLVSGFLIIGWIAVGITVTKLKTPPLPLSTEGCETNFQMSVEPTYLNSTMNSFAINQTSTTMATYEERYILPIYKMSFTWLRAVGWLITFVIGYISSCVIGIWQKQTFEDYRALTPLVRRFFKEKKIEKEIPL